MSYLKRNLNWVVRFDRVFVYAPRTNQTKYYFAINICFNWKHFLFVVFFFVKIILLLFSGSFHPCFLLYDWLSFKIFEVQSTHIICERPFARNKNYLQKKKKIQATQSKRVVDDWLMCAHDWLLGQKGGSLV